MSLLGLLRQMGPGYVAFRGGWELKRRLGWLARQTPARLRMPGEPPSLKAWQQRPGVWPYDAVQGPPLVRIPNRALAAQATRIRAGEVQFFGSEWKMLGLDWDWRTHPDTEYRYPMAHWSTLADFSAQAGDIKYVWEQARFGWVYTLLRDEHHHQPGDGAENGAFILGRIAHFIEHNPINLGPQYRCAQEMSLRLLAWAAALQHYRHHPALTQALFGQIAESIYGQVHHIRHTIAFARRAVRNNHAITECALLALAPVLWPWLPAECHRWAAQAQGWLCEEVRWQIYADGTYLQHSHNYHRVVVQTLARTARLLAVASRPLPADVMERLSASVDFLLACQEHGPAGSAESGPEPSQTGWLPNYGHNDGALFFPLAQAHFRDYRPALAAACAVLGRPSPYPPGPWDEEAAWLGYPALGEVPARSTGPVQQVGSQLWPVGGYAVLRGTGGHWAFARCGHHPHRPAQADNGHLDLWAAGHNILRDQGTYKYNADPATRLSFSGTPAHNTCSIGEAHQMQPGPRFVWYHWSQAIHHALLERVLAADDGRQTTWQGIEMCLKAFGHLEGGPYLHYRTLLQHPTRPLWRIEDRIQASQPNKATPPPMRQHWHPAPGLLESGRLRICAWANAKDAEPLQAHPLEGAYSSYYGQQEPAPHLYYQLPTGQTIITEIEYE